MATDKAPASTNGALGTTAHERRKAPRIDAFGEILGHIVSIGQRVVVLDVSTGGLGIAVREPLDVGSVHRLRLATRDGRSAEISARVVNIRETATPADTACYVVGIQLVEESEALNDIIDHLVSALSFDCDPVQP